MRRRTPVSAAVLFLQVASLGRNKDLPVLNTSQFYFNAGSTSCGYDVSLLYSIELRHNLDIYVTSEDRFLLRIMVLVQHGQAIFQPKRHGTPVSLSCNSACARSSTCPRVLTTPRADPP